MNETKSELEKIKLRQQELEARNRLLEKVAELDKATAKDDVQPHMQVQTLTLVPCICTQPASERAQA